MPSGRANGASVETGNRVSCTSPAFGWAMVRPRSRYTFVQRVRGEECAIGCDREWVSWESVISRSQEAPAQTSCRNPGRPAIPPTTK
jgi:hypothetical protein